MLQNGTLALWEDMKTHLFEYLFILMNTLETNEETAEKSRRILEKLLVSHLINALEITVMFRHSTLTL